MKESGVKKYPLPKQAGLITFESQDINQWV